ncbi:hypothetical protein PoB_001920400 [Plakobranchus ocellatus]|uniref:ZAD domain-containing protein n=1 Tax=Plakobranchus ocellatus TaxID=259542 RepID=A0AAV3ZBH8_9GAST|nr:hypothetical protein PoB_001920400 [Plakobranchus ocellatus]
MEERAHLQSSHATFTQKLCRICGLRALTKNQQTTNRKPYKCSSHVKAILQLFHIDVNQDKDIHSSSLCDSCYFRLINFERKPATEQTLQSALKIVNLNSNIWCAYDENLSSQQCTLCSHYIRLGRAGRKLKRKKSCFLNQTKESSNSPASPVEVSTPSLSLNTFQVSTQSLSLDTDYSISGLSNTISSPEHVTCHDIEPLETSTPVKKRRRHLFETNPGPSSSLFLETATSPMKSPNPPSTLKTDSSTSPIKDLIHTIQSYYEHQKWIARWGFGMGLHGEQGLELVHSSIKKIENQAQGLRRQEDQLEVVLRSHLTQVSPTLNSLLPRAAKHNK